MGYDHGDSFPFDFESNEIPFSSKSKGKLSPRSYPIQFEREMDIQFSQCKKIVNCAAHHKFHYYHLLCY